LRTRVQAFPQGVAFWLRKPALPPPYLTELIAWFENLTLQTLDQIDTIYAPRARFKDPFNDVEGLPAIRHVFHHMFHQVDAPRFRITDTFWNGQGAMVLWTFEFIARRPLPRQFFTIQGTTHFLFDAAGKVNMHRDYWDTAEELYAKLPLLGTVVKKLLRLGRA